MTLDTFQWGLLWSYLYLHVNYFAIPSFITPQDAYIWPQFYMWWDHLFIVIHHRSITFVYHEVVFAVSFNSLLSDVVCFTCTIWNWYYLMLWFPRIRRICCHSKCVCFGPWMCMTAQSQDPNQFWLNHPWFVVFTKGQFHRYHNQFSQGPLS